MALATEVGLSRKRDFIRKLYNADSPQEVLSRDASLSFGFGDLRLGNSCLRANPRREDSKILRLGAPPARFAAGLSPADAQGRRLARPPHRPALPPNHDRLS